MFAEFWTFKIHCGNMTMFQYLGETYIDANRICNV